MFFFFYVSGTDMTSSIIEIRFGVPSAMAHVMFMPVRR